MIHHTPTPPTEEEKKRLMPAIEEYFFSTLGGIPKDIEILEMVSELDKGCFYGVKVTCSCSFVLFSRLNLRSPCGIYWCIMLQSFTVLT